MRGVPGLSPQLLAGVGLSNIGVAELLLLTPELIKLGVDPEMAAKILPRIDRLPPVTDAVADMSAGATVRDGPVTLWASLSLSLSLSLFC